MTEFDRVATMLFDEWVRFGLFITGLVMIASMPLTGVWGFGSGVWLWGNCAVWCAVADSYEECE